MPQTKDHIGTRAIVAGGSLAGMLSARVLADHFDEVLVLDRDRFADAPENRRMTPQSFHAHILLKGGELAIEALLPGIVDEMRAHGAVPLELGYSFIASNDLGNAPRMHTGMFNLGQSRAQIEFLLRRRVLSDCQRIKLRTQHTVRGLQLSADGRRVTGAVIEDAAGVQTTEPADLVVDAGGRGAASLRWLAALGLSLPPVEEVVVDFGYSSSCFRLADDPSRDWVGLIAGTAPPRSYAGVLFPYEDGTHVCSVGGRFGQYPPTEPEPFLDYVQNIPGPMHSTLAAAEFTAPIVSIRFESNRFRHFERHAELVDGLLPIGDAVCSVNPTYGHGMSSTAKQVLSLHTVLRTRTHNDLHQLVRQQLHEGATIAGTPWRAACFNDLRYAQTKGDRSMFSTAETALRLRLSLLAQRNPEFAMRLGRLGQLIDLDTDVLQDTELQAAAAEIELPPAP